MEEFEIIQQIINNGRERALFSANYHFLQAYWNIGGFISIQLEQKKWGDKVVENLADWLKVQDPTLKGFDRRSLYRMRTFYETWNAKSIQETVRKSLPEKLVGNIQTVDNKEIAIVGTVSPQLTNLIVGTVTPQLTNETNLVTSQLSQMPHYLPKISWSHHLELLNSTKLEEEKVYYLGLIIKEKYKLRELRRQISSCLFERQVTSKQKLNVSHPGEEKINSIFKDTYITEFLNLPTAYSENDLQKELVDKMQQFILELGRDFIFIGKEFKLQVGMRDFFTDLLFFQRELNCLVAFELKIDIFQPEYLGKLEFYLEALDRDVKKPHENPSIGILLCKTHDTEVVEYAMSRNMSPALIAKYQTAMPDKKFLQQKIHELLDI